MSDYHGATVDLLTDAEYPAIYGVKAHQLLEATKAEVDKRWVRNASLWETNAFNGSCILGCLGFARWGEGFRREGQNEGYINLGLDPATRDAIATLAQHVSDRVRSENQEDSVSLVYRQNDVHFKTKRDVKDFIDNALAGPTGTETAK